MTESTSTDRRSQETKSSQDPVETSASSSLLSREENPEPDPITHADNDPFCINISKRSRIILYILTFLALVVFIGSTWCIDQCDPNSTIYWFIFPLWIISLLCIFVLGPWSLIVLAGKCGLTSTGYAELESE